uniref:Uncharacterized protein n=1 Tax=Anguilla anguilla TaxID=7936 RepID=A0A0E9SRD3_ANGAN
MNTLHGWRRQGVVSFTAALEKSLCTGWATKLGTRDKPA